jgi:hypothetical protein
MGKALKLIDLAHLMGFSLQEMKTGNILIQPEEHYVVLFNPGIKMYPDEVPMEERRKEIMQAARSVIHLLGGDYQTRTFPLNPDGNDPGFGPYTNHLLTLAGGGEWDAHVAHARFYELVDGFWKREFRPAKFYPR